jgi:poly(A) polymerase
MLRTLRFAAKLNFDIDPQILKIFDVDMTQLLRDVSPHRLYDESQKLFTMGHLARVLPMLIEFDIWKQLFADIKPDISKFIERAAKIPISVFRLVKPLTLHFSMQCCYGSLF